MRIDVDVLVWRGPIAESRHRVQVAVSAADGALAVSSEGAQAVTTFRSAAKPFQLLPLVERGHAQRLGLSDEALAILSASHTGSRYHVELVRGILARVGLTEGDLACGFHEPIDAETRADLLLHPERRSPVFNNCSGKHAGMLCLAKSEGWPTSGYERPEHPLQQLMRRTVAEVAGLEPQDLAVATDGCNVSVFGMPLAAMARAYAALAVARPGGDAREAALARIRAAMSAYPVAVGGEGRFSTVLMQATGGRLTAKGGAEGLQCVAIPSRGLGLALKCEDGDARPVAPATIAVLDHLGELASGELATLESFRRPVLSNHAGARVGLVEALVRAPVSASA